MPHAGACTRLLEAERVAIEWPCDGVLSSSPRRWRSVPDKVGSVRSPVWPLWNASELTSSPSHTVAVVTVRKMVQLGSLPLYPFFRVRVRVLFGGFFRIDSICVSFF
jgi:hypothetical protein